MLPIAITLETEYGNVGLSHAGVPLKFHSWEEFIRALDINPSVREDALWSRDVIGEFFDYYSGRRVPETLGVKRRWLDGVELTVHGHTGVYAPVVQDNQIWMDTAEKTNELSIFEVCELFDLVNINKDR